MTESEKNETLIKSFKWLSAQDIGSIKELARAVSAHALWDLPNSYTTRLLLEKRGGAWNSSVRDTARACSALADAGIIIRESEKWLLCKKTGDSWSENVYDTAYALRALGEMEILDRAACQWLYENYGPAWEQVGTTSLIITALQKQEDLKELKGRDEREKQNEKEKQGEGKEVRNFIRERANWLLSKRENEGGWKHISTSNLAIQALLFTGFKKEAEVSINWLMGQVHENGAWGNKEDDVNATALSLVTLGINRNL